MELLQLKYFYESAKNGSFSKTAKKFMVPLTSVSASIRRLEKELDCELFDRFSNCILLNANGKKLQKALFVAFSEVDTALTEIASKGEINNEIKVLVRGMRRKITDKIIKFNDLFPECIFKISFNFNETEYEEYDVIIDEESECYSNYRKFEFYTTRLRIKCSENNPMLGRRVLMKQLRDATFISMGEESNLHKILIGACRQAGFTPKISVLCNDLECYEKLIAGGIGIAIGKEKNQSPGIDFLDVSDFDERYTLYCYYKKSIYFGVVKKFIDFLK